MADLYKFRFELYIGRFSKDRLKIELDHAAITGNLERVQFLIKGITIDQYDLGWAVIYAAESGLLAIVQFLLSEGRTIDQRTLDLAVRCAAAKGHLAIVQFLMSEGREISQEDLGLAVMESAENGHSETVQFLLSEGRVLSLIYRNLIVLGISSAGNIAMLELILRNGPITELVRNSAITQARGSDRVRIIDMLNRAAITNEHISLDDAVSYGRITISLENLKKDPNDLFKFLSSTESFPRGFVLTEFPSAIDLGGVTKQVISTFFESLQDEYKGKYWSPDKFLINEVEGDDGSFYTDLAKVLSLIFKVNESRTDKLLIGSVFNKKFFSILKSYMQEGLDQEERIKQIATLMKNDDCNHDYYKSLFEFIVSKIVSKDDANKQNLVKLAQLVDKSVSNFDDFFANEKKNIFKPLEKFIEGLSQELKEKINSSEDVDNLLSGIQGAEITSERLKSALKFNIYIPDRVRTLILNKIDESDEKWLKGFVFSITGSYKLSSNTEIKINPSFRNAFEIHTCFNTLDLPLNVINSMSNDDFLVYLNSVIEKHESYNIA